MVIKFIGDVQRINSFGKWEPGKMYDVSNEVGEVLLTIPRLFEEVGKVKIVSNATKQIIPIDDVEEPVGGKADDDAGTIDAKNYNDMNIHQLMSVMTERGLPLRRNARKAELVMLLKENDGQA